MGRRRRRDRTEVLRWSPRRAEPRATIPDLAEQRATCAWSNDAEGLVGGLTRCSPLGYTGLRKRTAKALTAAKLPHVTLHEARHSFASYLAASGIGIKDLTVILGHSSVTVSLDRYGHLFEGALDRTRSQVDAWLDAANVPRTVDPLRSRSVAIALHE